MLCFVGMEFTDLLEGKLRPRARYASRNRTPASSTEEDCKTIRKERRIQRQNYSSRQGDRSGHRPSASSAQAVDLSVWQEVQGFGMWYLSVIAGDKTANVCARTFTSPSVVAIFGMWHATHWLPVEPFL